MAVVLPAGTRGGNLAAVPFGNDLEQEFLLPRGSVFRVSKVDSRGQVTDLELEARMEGRVTRESRRDEARGSMLKEAFPKFVWEEGDVEFLRD